MVSVVICCGLVVICCGQMPIDVKALSANLGNGIDGFQVAKKTKLVQKILDEYMVSGEEERVHSRHLLPDWCNRGGTAPEIQYVHMQLYPNIKRDGYDQRRHKCAFARKFDTPDNVRQLIAHSVNMDPNNGTYPPLVAHNVYAGTLGSSHFAIMFCLIDHGIVSVLTNDKFEIPHDDTNWQLVQNKGIKFIFRNLCGRRNVSGNVSNVLMNGSMNGGLFELGLAT